MVKKLFEIEHKGNWFLEPGGASMCPPKSIIKV